MNLGLEPDTLDSIHSDDIRSFIKVLDLWKKRQSSPYTWSTILEILNRPSINNNELAKEIKKKLRNQNQQNAPPTSQITAAKESEIQKEVDEILDKFATLNKEVKRAFSSISVNFAKACEIVDYVNSYMCLDVALTVENGSFDKIFDNIRKKISFLDPHRLENVAKQFPNIYEQLKSKFEDYQKDLNNFKNSHCMKDLVGRVKEVRESNNYTQTVYLKLHTCWDEVVVEKFEQLVKQICNDEALGPIEVIHNCLIVTWTTIRTLEVKELVKKIAFVAEFMAAIHVISFKVGDYTVYETEEEEDSLLTLDMCLVQALYTGPLQAVEMLLAIGGDPHQHLDTIPPDKETAITKAAKMSDPDGLTPLHVACEWGHDEVVSLLLTAGANPTATLQDGTTPLMLATKYGHRNIVIQLYTSTYVIVTSDYDSVTPAFKSDPMDIESDQTFKSHPMDKEADQTFKSTDSMDIESDQTFNSDPMDIESDQTFAYPSSYECTQKSDINTGTVAMIPNTLPLALTKDVVISTSTSYLSACSSKESLVVGICESYLYKYEKVLSLQSDHMDISF